MTIVPLTPPEFSPMFIRTIATVSVERCSHSWLVPSFFAKFTALGILFRQAPVLPRKFARQAMIARPEMDGLTLR
jgi:hypothetical protein